MQCLLRKLYTENRIIKPTTSLLQGVRFTAVNIPECPEGHIEEQKRYPCALPFLDLIFEEYDYKHNTPT